MMLTLGNVRIIAIVTNAISATCVTTSGSEIRTGTWKEKRIKVRGAAVYGCRAWSPVPFPRFFVRI